MRNDSAAKMMLRFSMAVFGTLGFGVVTIAEWKMTGNERIWVIFAGISCIIEETKSVQEEKT